jgi:hypothetical protein
MDLLFPNGLTLRNLRYIVVINNTVMIALAVLLVWIGLRGNKAQPVPLALFLTLYLISPFSLLVYMSSQLSLFFMETYQLVLLLIWLIVFIECRDKWYYYVLTFFVTTCCFLIHHTFLCTMYPLMLALFVYDALQDGKIVNKKTIVYGLNILVSLAIFMALWLFGEMNIDLDSLWAQIRAESPEICPTRTPFRLFYYISNAENSATEMSFDWRVRFCVELLMLLPLIVVFVAPWFMAAKQTKGLCNRLRYSMPPICLSLFSFPIFMVATDYSRWWVCFFFGLFALLLVSSYNDDIIKKTLLSFASYAKRHWWLVLILIVYMLQLHNSEHRVRGLEESERLITYIKSFL